MRAFKIIIRVIGLLICLGEYYSVLTKHQLVIFRAVLVSDWTMYILPLTAPFLAEFCIIAMLVTRKQIGDEKKTKPTSKASMPRKS